MTHLHTERKDEEKWRKKRNGKKIREGEEKKRREG